MPRIRFPVTMTFCVFAHFSSHAKKVTTSLISWHLLQTSQHAETLRDFELSCWLLKFFSLIYCRVSIEITKATTRKRSRERAKQKRKFKVKQKKFRTVIRTHQSTDKMAMREIRSRLLQLFDSISPGKSCRSVVVDCALVDWERRMQHKLCSRTGHFSNGKFIAVTFSHFVSFVTLAELAFCVTNMRFVSSTVSFVCS